MFCPDSLSVPKWSRSLLLNESVLSVFTRRHLFKGAVSMAIASALPGCASSMTSTDTVSSGRMVNGPNPQVAPTGSITQASFTVSSGTAGSIGSAFAGLSYEKSALTKSVFSASNANLIALFRRLGTSVLRIGGNTVDQNVWTLDGPGQISGQVAPRDVAALAAFVKATGWQILYGINLGGSATGATTPALAAAEVAYAAQQFGSSLLGIEIGNECDGYGSSGSCYAGDWSLARFQALWTQYRTAILDSTPTVPITGPASAGNITNWTIPFGKAVTGQEISLLSQHYYRGDGNLATSTAASLVSPDTSLVTHLKELQVAAQSIGIPYRMSECNSFYNGGASGVSNSYASSLWVIDYLFNCAQGGASGVNFHGGGGSSYTAIADLDGTVVGAHPEYYGILLFTLAGTGTLLPTQLSAGNLNVTAYAIKSDSGGINLVLVNKDSTQNLSVSVQLPQPVNSAILLEMTQATGTSGASLTATSGVTIQGAVVNPDGTFSPEAAYTPSTSGSQLSCYVRALSAVLIKIT
jgi:hypothetical protein